MIISFTIQGDSEGYVAFECPFCEEQFRLKADEIQGDDIEYHELYCPYCGLVSEVNNFYTKEAVKMIEQLVYNQMQEELNKSFKKLSRSVSRSKNIKVKWKPLKPSNVKELTTEDSIESEFKCEVCLSHIKVLYCAGESKVFCAYCGVDI